MINKLEIRWIWFLSALYVVVNAIFIYYEQYWFNAIPAAIIVGLMTLLSIEKVFWFIVFCTPLSLNLEKLEFGGIGMFLPTEPVLFLIMVLFILRLSYRMDYDKKIIMHPITLAIIFHLIWLIITTFTSVRLVVSLKFVLARMWFLITFYFIAIQVFRKVKNVNRFLWLYIIPLTMVIIYTVVNHYFHDFDDKPAHFVMRPFYKDHTSYGAILVMYFPILLYLFYHYKKFSIKFYTAILIIIFSAGIVFSYTRAAWLSLAASVVLWAIYKLKIKFSYLFGTALLGLVILAMSWSQILMTLEQNRDESSSDFSEHIRSMSNISSDASNLERINRWESAIKMFQEKPIFGWGPGTYMFEYAPFQHSQSMTIISTNAGRLGNAHSEYIGPLAESGVLGSLSFILIVCLMFYHGSRLYHRLPLGQHKALILAVMVGFCTYVLHGFLNNYLDTDKASLPFWGFIAIIVTYDIYWAELSQKSDTH
ncbi:MAG: O-antigen ligase family protein [Vicingaceae bacterium]